jgi:hypothetical protein
MHSQKANATGNDERSRRQAPSMAIPFSHRKVDSVGALFPKSRHELSMPNLFEGAKEVSLPLVRDLQVDNN